MLSKNDLKLFEILDEFVDKSDSDWCIVMFSWRIVWHYPTLSTVLRYIENHRNKRFRKIYTNWLICFAVDGPTYTFDLTKELKDRSEEQKEELINFLLSIS